MLGGAELGDEGALAVADEHGALAGGLVGDHVAGLSGGMRRDTGQGRRVGAHSQASCGHAWPAQSVFSPLLEQR